MRLPTPIDQGDSGSTEIVLSLIVPTRARPDSLRYLCDSLVRQTHRLDQLEMVLVIDTDDEPSATFEYPGLAMRKTAVPPGTSMGALNMAGYRASAGRYVMLMNDDVSIRTRGWDEQVMSALRQFPDEMVLIHVNDVLFGDRLCTFPLVSRRFCEMAGEFCPAGYRRYGIDNHIQNVFDLLSLLGYRRRIFLADIIFEHGNVREAPDGLHYVPDRGIHHADMELFEKLQPERQRLALAAREVIQRASTAEAHSAGASRSEVTIAVLTADRNSSRARSCVQRIEEHTSNYRLAIAEYGGPGVNRAREINRLLESAHSGYLVVVSDDVLVERGWLEGLVRAVERGVGAVTPLHVDADGGITYAGLAIQPDDSGAVAPVLRIGDRPQPIEGMNGSALLLDVSVCGAVRLDETYSGEFLDLDYGLRIWEQGCQVVCSPWSRVQVGEASPASDPQQRLRFIREWLETGRLQQLRLRFWEAIDGFREFAALRRELDNLLGEAGVCSHDDFFHRARAAISKIVHLPALRNYLVARAREELGPRPARADDPQLGNWAVLLGLLEQPVLYERGVYGMNVVLCGGVFYAIPGPEEVFRRTRVRAGEYVRSYESGDPARIRQAIARAWARTPVGHVRADSVPDSKDEQDFGELNFHTEAVPVLFDARTVASVVQRVARATPYLPFLGSRNGLFDAEYYRKSYPEAMANGVAPLLHFIAAGAFEGCKPHPLFDPAFYFWKSPDVRQANLNPLGHYWRYGAAEGRQPHPLFDTAYYLERYPDVRQSGTNPLLHYVRQGAAEGRQPHPWFEPAYYLRQCPDARAAANPLIHFLESPATAIANPHPLFDCDYYARQSPAGSPVYINPLIHYLLFGVTHGRRPSADFDATRAHAVVTGMPIGQ